MSKPLIPFDRWLSGTNENSIPANDNSLRSEILGGSAISNVVTAQPAFASPADDGKWYVIPPGATGSQWATFAMDSAAIFYGGTWYEFTPVQDIILGISGDLYRYSGSNGWEPVSGGGSGVTSINGHTGAVTFLTPIIAACSDETTALTAGTNKIKFRLGQAMTLTAVRGSLTTAQASGSTFTVDINSNGSTILSTKITIDNTETTSVTAAVPPVISSSSLPDNAEISVDIDTVGDGTATGLKVTLIGYPT